MQTFAPSATSLVATPSPIPRLAPVTSATLPAKRSMDARLAIGAQQPDDLVRMPGAQHPVRRRVVLVVEPQLYARPDPGTDRDEPSRVAFASDHTAERPRVQG